MAAATNASPHRAVRTAPSAAGIAAQANDHDLPLLEPTLAGIPDMIGPLPDRRCMHLDRGYDSRKTRDLLEILGYDDDRGQRSPRPDRGRQALAGGTHPLLDERLRQAPPVHRQTQGHRWIQACV